MQEYKCSVFCCLSLVVALTLIPSDIFGKDTFTPAWTAKTIP